MFTGIAGFKRESESRALPFSLSCVQSSCVKRQSAESSQSGDKGRGWVTLLLQCGVNCEQRGVWVCSLCPAPCWAHGNRSWCGDGECWGYRRAVCRVGNRDCSGNGSLALSRLLSLLSGSFPRTWIHGNKNFAMLNKVNHTSKHINSEVPISLKFRSKQSRILLKA